MESNMLHTNRPAAGEVIKLSMTSPVRYLVEGINKFGDLTVSAIGQKQVTEIVIHADTKTFKAE